MATVSLVLGSGGARGLAHIGVIRWLEENGHEIQSIAGCSAGAVVGGVYAAGEIDAFEAWMRSIRRREVITLLDIAWSKAGLVRGNKLISALTKIVGTHNIEDLPIKFTAVAADMTNEKEVWLNKGDLFSAIRASISIPLFFTPYAVNGSLLVDGGVLNPVPIAPTFGDATDFTIAVNLDADDEGGSPKMVSEAEPEKASRIQEALAAISARLYKSDREENQSEGDVFSVALQAFETMQSAIARQKLAAYPPDYLVEVPRTAARMMEFDRAEELITLGYEKAEAVLANKLK